MPYIKSPLKWVGGKTQLLPTLVSNFNLVKKHITSYYEPFLGGGALLLNLLNIESTPPLLSSFSLNNIRYYASDKNQSLINLWRLIQENPNGLIEELEVMFDRYNSYSEVNQELYYLEIRKSFNLNQSLNPVLLYFLNKTCFNGLFRLNRLNQFNVGWNKKRQIKLDKNNLLAVSDLIKNVTFFSGDYVAFPVLNKVFYYLDPPYLPVSKTSSFANYCGSFTEEDQVRVKEYCDEITKNNSYFLLSNSFHPFLQNLYKNYSIEVIQATRAVNCNPSNRGNVNELLIKNF